MKRERLRNLTKNLLKARRLILASRAQLVLFKINMMSYKRHIEIFEVQIDALWSSNSKAINLSFLSSNTLSQASIKSKPSRRDLSQILSDSFNL
jgi:hypothetical protein